MLGIYISVRLIAFSIYADINRIKMFSFVLKRTSVNATLATRVANVFDTKRSMAMSGVLWEA